MQNSFAAATGRMQATATRDGDDRGRGGPGERPRPDLAAENDDRRQQHQHICGKIVDRQADRGKRQQQLAELAPATGAPDAISLADGVPAPALRYYPLA